MPFVHGFVHGGSRGSVLPRPFALVLCDLHRGERAADEFAQVIRGMCKVPTAVMAGAPVTEVQAVEQAIRAKGREPVLLATRSAELTRFRATPRKVLGLNTTQEPHTLTQPPTSPWQITYSLWMLAPGISAPGA